MNPSKIWIGTSGWNYKHWRGRFYPEELKHAEEFEYYQHFFDTVELNNPFYHLPPPETFKHWKAETPKDFVFAVKASRYITHMKKLKDAGDALDTFFSNARLLGKKLGPVLFQLPPGWKVNEERLGDFLKQLPKKKKYAFEFRNTTWYTEGVYQLLRKYNCAFCIYELAGHTSPLQVTADFVYIRLHGPGNKYQGNYSTATLKKWTKKMTEWSSEGKEVYMYFDNDQNAYAAFNAQKIKELTSRIPT